MDKTVRLSPFKVIQDDADQGSDTYRALRLSSSKPSSVPKLRLSLPSLTTGSVYISPRERRKQSLTSRYTDQFSFVHNDFSTPKVIKASHDISIPSPRRNFKTACLTTKPETILLNNRKVSRNLIMDCFPNCN
ncbi:unnamed protein product [Blepharisma stoltei]|uniref:Uncharacterized protein n=1 Tax=Blepharisma stoltei TaxID=1481888 RepID=A0AAU9JL82_9CILI|nr:unnamed protein product [Blepharisma stoltei]